MSEVFIFEKLVKEIAAQKGVLTDSTDSFKEETVITALKKFISRTYNKGIESVLIDVEKAAKEQVEQALGMEYNTWSKTYRYNRDSVLRKEIIDILRPKIEEVATISVQELDFRFRPTAKEKDEIKERCRRIYHDELLNTIQCKMAEKIRNKARADAAQLFEDIEVATMDSCTIDDVVANRFTRMMLDNEDTNNNKFSLSFESFLKQLVWMEEDAKSTTEQTGTT
jgi:hypothetical protein